MAEVGGAPGYATPLWAGRRRPRAAPGTVGAQPLAGRAGAGPAPPDPGTSPSACTGGPSPAGPPRPVPPPARGGSAPHTPWGSRSPPGSRRNEGSTRSDARGSRVYCSRGERYSVGVRGTRPSRVQPAAGVGGMSLSDAGGPGRGGSAGPGPARGGCEVAVEVGEGGRVRRGLLGGARGHCHRHRVLLQQIGVKGHPTEEGVALEVVEVAQAAQGVVAQQLGMEGGQ